ncbi:MAG: diaminopimelate dehydrogenase [Nitrospirae bacterium]|jgi:diaminopimelate dehydrogenase|nr:diaminopimelate dehydrogenase [Nitrospirota bacterium]
MKPLRLAIVGFGRVGQVCAELISLSHDLGLAAIVRRAASAGGKLPETLRSIPVTIHIGQARDVDAALICVPTNVVREAASQILQHGIPIVDCATLHGEALHTHKDTIRKMALHHGVPAIVGAGWDPGALSVFRSWFALLTPGGSTETQHHAGTSLRHTTMARSVRGVEDALCAEVRANDGRVQRYVYVELEKGADVDKITQAIRADPLFLGEDTQVFPVENLAELEQEGRGVVLDRRGSPGRFGHQHLLLEARFDETVLTARIMLAAARALLQLEPGAYALTEIPLSAMWGERAENAHRDWL